MGDAADHGPIAPEHVLIMNEIARALDDLLNGDHCKAEDKKVWFFLACGNFNDPADRFNYISNADKLDVRATLKDVLARLEGRLGEAGSA